MNILVHRRIWRHRAPPYCAEGHARGHAMSAFELDNELNRKKAVEMQPYVKHIFWGDLAKPKRC